MKSILIVTVWMLFIELSSAQTNIQSSEVTTFKNNLRELRNNINDLNILSNRNLESFNSLINHTILEINPDTKSIPFQYQNSIKDMVVFSEKLKEQSDTIQDTAIAILLKDLKLKFENEGENMTSSTGFKLIEVEVETRLNSKPVNDLLIHYSGIGYRANYENPFYTFRNPSSPSKELLSPGLYRFWITKRGDTSKLDERRIEVIPNRDNKIILYADPSL